MMYKPLINQRLTEILSKVITNDRAFNSITEDKKFAISGISVRALELYTYIKLYTNLYYKK